jgi:hypothetical protein
MLSNDKYRSFEKRRAGILLSFSLRSMMLKILDLSLVFFSVFH